MRSGKAPKPFPTSSPASIGRLDPGLSGAAALSTLAHLEHLIARGAVKSDSPPTLDGKLPAERYGARGLAAGFRLKLRVEVGEETSDPPRVLAKIVRADAGCRAHVHSGAVGRIPQAHHDVAEESRR